MLKDILNLITLEPLIVLMRFGIGVLHGAQIQTDLLLWKICHLELNYTEDICANLTLDEYDSINNAVQEKANNIQLVVDWLVSGSALAWCLISGSLLDKFGPKFFILLPLFGMFVSDVGNLLNYAFIEYLPLEFFYIEAIYGICGGNPMYFMGKKLTIFS